MPRKQEDTDKFKGNVMKQRKMAPILAITISVQLMVSPLSYAEGTTTEATPEDKPAAKKTSKAAMLNTAAEAVGAGLQITGEILKSVQNARQGNTLSTQMAFDMQKLKDQQTPQVDKYFNLQKLSMIPGLTNYLAMNNINPQSLNCQTLPTTLHEARPEVCRLGVMSDSGAPPQAQLSQMFTYYNEYFQVNKMYKNYSADSNSEGQSFGIGCMKNAMQVLNGFFKHRIDELDKLNTNLEAMNNQFREASRADLDALEEAVAVLDGGESILSDKVRTKNPDLFDFAKRFNNPACLSILSDQKFNETGTSGGLNKIKKDLRDKLSLKTGKFSGESYSQSHASVVEDIGSLANKVSKQFELNYGSIAKSPAAYGQFLANIKNLVSSPNNINNALTPDLFSDVQAKFNENYIKLTESRNTIESELNSYGPGNALNLLGNLNSSNFEAEVSTLENRIKNKCLASSVGDMDYLLGKIYDPSASDHANTNASNFLKDKLKQIMDNDSTSIEKKLAELKSLESQTGSRYYMKMENSYEVQQLDSNGNLVTKVVGASTNRTPSVYFSDVINNCNAQFKANNLNNKLSGAAAISKLRQLNQDYKKLASSQAAEMKNELRKKLIECSSPEEANNSAVGSCTPERFNTSSPSFCANAALSCSKNMQACTQQADNFAKEVKTQKTARANNYKALLQKNKHDIVKIFDTALSEYMKQGEALRGLFGAGFSSPSGIQREVPEGQRYLNEFADATSGSPDGRLLLEDPDKYVEMFKHNIALLKDSVKKQQDQILGGESLSGNNSGLLAEHIKKTEKNYKDVITESDTIATNCRQNHDNAVMAAQAARAKQQEEDAKRASELGEKLPRFCARYESVMSSSNPLDACGRMKDDVIKPAYMAAAQSGPNSAEDTKLIAQFESLCGGVNNSSQSGSDNFPPPSTMCQKLGKDHNDCKNYLRFYESEDGCVAVSEKGSADRCKPYLDNIKAAYRHEVRNSSLSSSVGQVDDGDGLDTLSASNSAPSFCEAGDNSSNRSGIGKAIMNIGGTIAAEIRGATQQ